MVSVGMSTGVILLYRMYLWSLQYLQYPSLPMWALIGLRPKVPSNTISYEKVHRVGLISPLLLVPCVLTWARAVILPSLASLCLSFASPVRFSWCYCTPQHIPLSPRWWCAYFSQRIGGTTTSHCVCGTVMGPVTGTMTRDHERAGAPLGLWTQQGTGLLSTTPSY
jgi:hypothetical protein